MYVLTAVTFVILIVPPSLIKIPSPSANAVVPLAVPPSIKFISVAVVVTATSSFIFGEVKVLFVKVSVVALPTKVSVAAGSVKVTFPE